MIQFFQKRMNKKGFTLVELLIVIAVLGIIAAIAVPRMAGVTSAVREDADDRQMDLIFRNLEARILAGVITDTQLTNGDAIAVTTDIYGEELPDSQVTGNAFTVTITRTGDSYVINAHDSNATEGDRRTGSHSFTWDN